jgi:peptide/nickel transport system substrate-binding protein
VRMWPMPGLQLTCRGRNRRRRKLAHFDRVEWRIIPDPTTATAALQSGEVDWYEVVEPDLVPLLRRNADIRLAPQNPTGYNGALRFNHLHPPFDNVRVRRAVTMGVRQTDYMQVATGGDMNAYRTCRSMFPCGSYYGSDFATDAMQGDINKARAMLAASGYNGEKAVIINPTDLPSVGQMGNVTYDLLRRMRMNVEMAASDWGTVVKRRMSRQPVEEGGWSIFHTYGPSNTRWTPIEHKMIRGLGATAFPGWHRDDVMEAMTRRYVEAPTRAERDAIVHDIQARAFEMVPFCAARDLPGLDGISCQPDGGHLVQCSVFLECSGAGVSWGGRTAAARGRTMAGTSS